MYQFKWLEETLWFCAVAVLPVLLDALVKFDPNEIKDWQTWGISIAAACVRALGGAGLAAIGRAQLRARQG